LGGLRDAIAASARLTPGLWVMWPAWRASTAISLTGRDRSRCPDRAGWSAPSSASRCKVVIRASPSTIAAFTFTVCVLRTAEQSIEASRVLGSPNLNLHGTGLDGKGLPVRPVEVVTGDMWISAEATLRRVADLGKRYDVVFTLENLNLAVDHPGTPFARAEDTLALVCSVGSPHLRMNLDLYHAQIGEGNLVELLRRSPPWVGEIQVADVPGRCEPGTGEINYPFLARELRRLGYEGTIGMEAWASGISDVAVEAFRVAFST
jgi:hydroxypyruvate isomerase